VAISCTFLGRKELEVEMSCCSGLLGCYPCLKMTRSHCCYCYLMRMAVARLAVGVRRVWCGVLLFSLFKRLNSQNVKNFGVIQPFLQLFLPVKTFSTEVYDELTAHRVYRKWLPCCRRLQRPGPSSSSSNSGSSSSSSKDSNPRVQNNSSPPHQVHFRPKKVQEIATPTTKDKTISIEEVTAEFQGLNSSFLNMDTQQG
jgi:hypothetical protein